MTIQMYDTITIETVPPNPEAVAGYVGGHWPTYNALVQKFPHAHHLSIAVNAGEDAECLDIEAGDAVPAQGPAWVKRQLARGVKRPVVYASVSSMQTVIDILESSGLHRGEFRVWTAHYTFTAHLCGPHCGFGFRDNADATQWTDRALGRNLDESQLVDNFFGSTIDVNHYDWYDGQPVKLFGKKYIERNVVKEYDRLRAMQSRRRHPRRFRLHILRLQLNLLHGRLVRISKGKPDVYHRDWRKQQLAARVRGERIAK